MARMPAASWVGPTVNEGDGDGHPGEPTDRMSTVVGVVLHIQQGTQAGSETWQRNPKARVSSHFLVARGGRIDQMVDTTDRAWCQVAGNRHFLSIELEGWAGNPMTPAQLESCARIMVWASHAHAVPLRLCDNPNATAPATGGLAYHSLGGAAWGGHFNCPGSLIVAQRGEIISRARTLANGGTVPESLTPDEQKELGDTAWTTTHIGDPDNPTGPRIPLHVAMTRVLQSLKRIEAALPPPPQT